MHWCKSIALILTCAPSLIQLAAFREISHVATGTPITQYNKVDKNYRPPLDRGSRVVFMSSYLSNAHGTRATAAVVLGAALAAVMVSLGM